MNNDDKPICPICRDFVLETARFSKSIDIDGATVEVPELECWLCLGCGATTIFQDQDTRNAGRIETAKARHNNA